MTRYVGKVKLSEKLDGMSELSLLYTYNGKMYGNLYMTQCSMLFNEIKPTTTSFYLYMANDGNVFVLEDGDYIEVNDK